MDHARRTNTYIKEVKQFRQLAARILHVLSVKTEEATLPLSPQRDSTANAAPTPQAGSMESGSQVSLENGDWVYFACSNDMGLVAVF